MRLPGSARKSWLGDLTERYHEALLQTPEALSYLDARGLDLEQVSTARLGLVATPDPAHRRYENWLSIPYITPTGVVHMRFRCMAQLEDPEHHCEGHGKYEGPQGEENHLYNVRILSDPKHSVIAVTEGEPDALVSTKAGLPAVGTVGTNGWKPFYNRLVDDYDRVIVLGDGDKAGRDFTVKLAGSLHNGVQRPLPEGEDVSSFVCKYGTEEFLNYAVGQGFADNATLAQAK